MADGFFLADEHHKKVNGEIVTLKNQLHFRHEKSGFESKAVPEHTKSYPELFKQFRLKHPDYVLPSSFSVEEIGSPSVEIVPVVEIAPIVEEPKRSQEGATEESKTEPEQKPRRVR
jgi:hypothetical protein